MQGNGLWDNLYSLNKATELEADFEEAGIIDEPMPEGSSGGGSDDDSGGKEKKPKPDDPENLPHKGENLTNKQKFENRMATWEAKKKDRKDKKASDKKAKTAKKEKKDEQTEISKAEKQKESADSKRKKFSEKVFNKESNEDRKDTAKQAEADVTPSQDSYNDVMKMGAGIHAATQLGYGKTENDSDSENRNSLTDASLAGQDSRLYDLENPP